MTGAREICLAAATAAVLLPGAAVAQGGKAGVTFFTGANFSGSSKTLTLAPDQPYAAVPFVGNELNEKIASLRADAQVGAILFQRPYFASRDDGCGPSLGSVENPDAWWLGMTADFAPPFAGDGPYEAAEAADSDYSSVIAYRRESGPPPGFLLMERRSYYNRVCERRTDQSYFNRLFVPVPNPPQREACVNLSVPASAQGAGPDAPRFTRLTDAIALHPEAFSARYRGIDHRFVLTVFDGPACEGASISLPSRNDGRPAQYRLSEFNFDRKARSVMIRYQRGPLDRYLKDDAAPAQTATLTPAPTAPAAPEPETPPAATSIEPEPSPAPAVRETAPQTAATPSASQPPQADPAPSAGGLQPGPPAAPPQPRQQTLQPVPEPQVVPTVPVVPAPSGPSGPQEETFRFPVHQDYRLNFCLDDEQGCGEPAANQWCEAQGFSRAKRWSHEENIGALYPTVFIGSGGICNRFLCDGFEEITCAR